MKWFDYRRPGYYTLRGHGGTLKSFQGHDFFTELRTKTNVHLVHNYFPGLVGCSRCLTSSNCDTHLKGYAQLVINRYPFLEPDHVIAHKANPRHTTMPEVNTRERRAPTGLHTSCRRLPVTRTSLNILFGQGRGV